MSLLAATYPTTAGYLAVPVPRRRQVYSVRELQRWVLGTATVFLVAGSLIGLAVGYPLALRDTESSLLLVSDRYTGIMDNTALASLLGDPSSWQPCREVAAP